MAEPRVTLDQLNIVVEDMDRAREFYERLGLEIPDTLPEWRRHHRAIDRPGGIDADLDSAAFARMWNQGWTEGAAGVVIGFRVRSREEVDALYAELTEAGHPGEQPPYDAFWGARYAVVRDPSGNSIGLMSPVDPDRRRPPPDAPD